MMKFSKDSSGFTAVELLVTLFVAAAFLIAGYQLFSVVIRDGGQTRAEANASNVAYDYLRQYSTSATNPCAPLTPLNEEPVTIEGLVSVSATVAITCPNSDAAGISKVKVTIKYNNPQQTVQYSTFVNGISGASAVMEGLVGWWKFNGNALDSSGNGNNGIATAVTPTTGPSGSPDSAYSFNGTSSFIRTDMNGFPSSMSNTTISLWARPASASNTSILVANPDVNTDRLNIHLPWGDSTIYWDHGLAVDAATGRVSASFNPAWINVWAHWVFTSGTESGMQIYRNGTQIANSTNSSAFSVGSSQLDIGYYGGSTYWNGSIDDLRIYKRVLSGPEITAIYNEGAL